MPGERAWMSAWMRSFSGLGGFENSAGYSFLSCGPQSSWAGLAAASASCSAAGASAAGAASVTCTAASTAGAAPSAAAGGDSLRAAAAGEASDAASAACSDTGVDSSPAGGVEDGGSEDMRQRKLSGEGAYCRNDWPRALRGGEPGCEKCVNGGYAAPGRARYFEAVAAPACASAF